MKRRQYKKLCKKLSDIYPGMFHQYKDPGEEDHGIYGTSIETGFGDYDWVSALDYIGNVFMYSHAIYDDKFKHGIKFVGPKATGKNILAFARVTPFVKKEHYYE